GKNCGYRGTHPFPSADGASFGKACIRMRSRGGEEKLPDTRTFGRTSMRHSVFSLVGTGRLSLVISAFFISLLLACSHLPPSSKTNASKRVEALDKSLTALKAEFNRDPSKPRLVALFSPTCGGCIYGAEALQHEAQKLTELSETTGLLIVWVSM